MGRLLFFLALLTTAGCRSAGLPGDPLFADRKVVESKTVAGAVAATPFTEPSPPPLTFFFSRRMP